MSIELVRVWTVEEVVEWLREKGLNDITLDVGYVDFFLLKSRASGPRERARAADLAAKFASATGVMPHVFVEFNTPFGKYLYPDPAYYPVASAAVPYVRLDCTRPERARKCWDALQHLVALLKVPEQQELVEALRGAAFTDIAIPQPPTTPQSGGEKPSGGAVESAAEGVTEEASAAAVASQAQRHRDEVARGAAVEVDSTEEEREAIGVEEEAAGAVSSVETAGTREPPGGDVGLVLKILGLDLAPLIEKYGERAVRGLRAFVELAERRPEVLDAVKERLVGAGCRVVEEAGCDAVTEAWDTVARLRRLYGDVGVLLDEDVAYVAKKFAALDEETRKRVLKAFEAL